MAAYKISVILAVTLSVAAKAQYQLPPSVERQGFSYSPEDPNIYQYQGQFEAYRQQPQRVSQDFSNGARSSSTFNFGQRKVAVQVNHHGANSFVNYDGHQGAPGYQFSSTLAERAEPSPQNYQLTNNIPSRNSYASSNSQRNADYNAPSNVNYNQQNAPQDPYSITNPINGQKYALNQPTWDHSAYDVNINYKNQENPFTTAAPPLHNFQFHNNFVPQTNIFSQFGQRAPSQSSFVINNRPVYSNPTLANFQNAFSQNPGYNLQIPQHDLNYQLSDPNLSKIQQNLVYSQPSSGDLQFRFSDVPQVDNTVKKLPEVPSFESGKLTTKQEIIKNTTVITLIDEEIQQEVGTTSAPITTQQSIPEVFDLPTVEDAKVKSRPPTIVQPTGTSYERQGQYYNNLVNVPDYSILYRSQATPTKEPAKSVPHNFNLYFQPTPGLETSTPVAPVDQRLHQPADYYSQTTPKQQQHSEFVFYQPTPASPANNFQGLLPNQINNGLSSNGNSQEFNPVEDKNQIKETLFSVNGFEEDLPDKATEKTISHLSGIGLEQSVTEHISETQTTTEFPTTSTAANLFQNVFSGTTVDASHRNSYHYPENLPNDNGQRVGITPDAAIGEYSPEQYSNSPKIELEKVTERIPESVSNQNHYYSFESSSTHPTTTLTDENVATVTVSSDTPVDSQSTISTSSYDREAALRRKKVRVYKKPSTEQRFGEEQLSINRERVSKPRNEYRGRRIRPNQQNSITTSLPETTQRVIPRGRYHATIPHRGRITFHRTTTEAVVDETSPQPTAVLEYNQEPVSQPISSTASHLQEQNFFTHPLPTSTTRDFERDRTTQAVTASQSRIPQVRYQIRPRTRTTIPHYRHQTTTILQETTTPMTEEIRTTEVTKFTSRIQSNTRQETIEYEQTHPTEAAVDLTEPVKEPEQVYTPQRARPRGPYQRGPGETINKQNRPVFSLKKHNINGRLRVTNPTVNDEQGEQPEERTQLRYHAVKQSPQRQTIIKRIKVHRKPDSSEMEDQDASGTIRTSYRRNEALQDSLNKKVLSPLVKNSIRFPPRKPLSRFSITTPTVEKHELSTEFTVNHETSEMTVSQNQDNLGTTITTLQETQHDTTEKNQVYLESTTTRVTEKRQTPDDQDLKDVIENTQGLEEENKSFEEQQEESLLSIKDQNIHFEDELSANPSNIFTADTDELISKEESFEDVIVHSLPEESESSIPSEIIDDPIDTDVIPSMSPSQNPLDIVTRIEVVTSISEDDGQNRRVNEMYELEQ